jgi:hypothetical protein
LRHDIARAGISPELAVQNVFNYLPCKVMPLLPVIRMRKENPFDRRS